MDILLIDSPVTRYSSEEEIIEWIAELESKEETTEVIKAIKDAKKDLKNRISTE